MVSDLRKVLRFFQLKRIIIPIVIGLGVAAWLIIRDFETEHLSGVQWSGYMVGWLLAAICLQAIRDIAYMYRIRLMTDKQISWRHSFDVIMLWEFASSITPSVVGGSAIALIIVHKEGISVGKSTAIVMVTAMLDELFYILMVPLILLLIGTSNLFTSSQLFLMNWGSEGVFIAGYVFILLLTTIITYAIFLNPRGFKWILLKIFKLKFLKRWRYDAARTGDDIITTSREMKGKSWKFWLKAYGATVFSWTARFWVVNCLILAFNPAVQDQLLIYGRQLVMWVILLISPTPGSSGIAEYAFPMFLGEFIPQGFEAAVGLLWRILSYYPYLVIGVIVLPFWIRRVFLKRKLIRFRSV
ncbi:MAG: flippase-like domain-containing protein [Bacteroidetes bacterium]|nr:flippase-like domain-containing protein [Bacteroidota bacterium]